MVGLLLLWSLNGFAADPGLGRTWKKLAHDEMLTIGYFGGSDTLLWRPQTTAWFRSQFPKAAITEINASIGGTTSELGAYRCRHDLLTGNPDLVFIDFAVPDRWLSAEKETLSIESIVRQIWKANPKTDIVFVYSASEDMMKNYDAGQDPGSVTLQQTVADHYGIPSVNMGKLVWQAIQDGKGTWETLMSTNTPQPPDAGLSIYAQGIQTFLEAHQKDAEAVPASELPEPLASAALTEPQMIDSWGVNAPGWSQQDSVPRLPFKHGISAGAGAKLDYAFNGSTIGLYWLIAPDSGDISYFIDSGSPQKASSWNQFGVTWIHGDSVILADDLPSGPHTLHLEVLSTKAAESTGNQVCLGAFLVR